MNRGTASLQDADAFHEFAEQQLPILRHEYPYSNDAILFAVAIERWNNGNPRTARVLNAERTERAMEFQLLLLTEVLRDIFNRSGTPNARISRETYNNIYTDLSNYIDKFNLFELKQNYQNQILEVAERVPSRLGAVIVSQLRSNNSRDSNFKQSDITNYENYRLQYPENGSRSSNYRVPIFTFNYTPRRVDLSSANIDPSITIEMIRNMPLATQFPQLQGFGTAYYAVDRYPNLSLQDAVARYNADLGRVQTSRRTPVTRRTTVIPANGGATATGRVTEARRAEREAFNPTTGNAIITPARQAERDTIINLLTDDTRRTTVNPTTGRATVNPARPPVNVNYITDVTKAIQQDKIEKKVDMVNYTHIINYYYKCTNPNSHPFNMDSIISYCAKSNTRDACKICPACRQPMDLNLYRQPKIVSDVFAKIFDDFIIDEEELVPERIEFMDKLIPILKKRPEILNLFRIDDEERTKMVEDYLVALSESDVEALRNGLEYSDVPEYMDFEDASEE